VTLKKSGPTYGPEKRREQKKQDHCYSKREKTRLPLFFLNNNDPVVLHPAFSRYFF
jgi:hypothetical protein